MWGLNFSLRVTTTTDVFILIQSGHQVLTLNQFMLNNGKQQTQHRLLADNVKNQNHY